MFIRNAWYVAGRSCDFDRTLQALEILGERIVFYRLEDGTPAALEDACPHRKLPLSKGNLKGDLVECGYHGLTFDKAGTCVRAPTQEGMPPRRAVVRSYPVADRYGFLWIWTGETRLASPDDIYHVANYGSPAWACTEHGAMTIECNYLWIMDNLLDPSHVAWVHVTSFAGAGTGNLPLDITPLSDGVTVSRWILDCEPPPYYAGLVTFSGNADRCQHYECRLPSVAVNKSVYTPAGKGGDGRLLPDDAFVNISYNFMTPVDDNNTRYFWFQHRNQRVDDAEVSRQMFEGAKMAFQEDREVLKEVHKGMKSSPTPHINLGLDAGAMKFRKLVSQRIEQEKSTAVAANA